MKYTIDQIADIIGARRPGRTDATINWLLTDSRSLCFPEETLFFALETHKNDGHKFIAELAQRGVRNFVVASDYNDASLGSDPSLNFLRVA